MAIVICMDGLGGHPETTFKHLKIALEASGHRVVYVPVEAIETHEDRIERVILWFRRHVPLGGKIILVGQSAGGSAVRIAAERLKGESALAGIVLLSQAMPRWTWYMTWPAHQRPSPREHRHFGHDSRASTRSVPDCHHGRRRGDDCHAQSSIG